MTPDEAAGQPAADELEFLDRSNPPQHAELVGFVFGFPGLYATPDGPRLKHCSHLLGVLPAYRDQGLGFQLKRAQWQMVRHQGIDRITWTYDPLLSRNAHLNIARLGTVCNTYIRDAYGEMRDELNTGRAFRPLPGGLVGQFQARLAPDEQAPAAAAGSGALPGCRDTDHQPKPSIDAGRPAPPGNKPDELTALRPGNPCCLVEIPADFLALKAADRELAIAWRLHTRSLFEELFQSGYLVTDLVYLPGTQPRSFYVMTYGEAEIMGVNKTDSLVQFVVGCFLSIIYSTFKFGSTPTGYGDIHI